VTRENRESEGTTMGRGGVVQSLQPGGIDRASKLARVAVNPVYRGIEGHCNEET